jgi:DNA-binding HxlR family transcriptional regulator
VARALDVVGDRWSLLIVRELMIGPRRYTDLQDGLPGIGTNVLAARLRELYDAEIVTKRDVPPPTAVTVYELTDAGRALGPTLAALRSWGAEHAPAGRAEDAVRPAWVLMSATATSKHVTPAKVCELRVDGEFFRLASDASGLSVRGGPADRPDAAIVLGAAALYALVAGRKSPKAVARESTIEGDRNFAAEILTAFYAAV